MKVCYKDIKKEEDSYGYLDSTFTRSRQVNE